MMLGEVLGVYVKYDSWSVRARQYVLGLCWYEWLVDGHDRVDLPENSRNELRDSSLSVRTGELRSHAWLRVSIRRLIIQLVRYTSLQIEVWSKKMSLKFQKHQEIMKTSKVSSSTNAGRCHRLEIVKCQREDRVKIV